MLKTSPPVYRIRPVVSAPSGSMERFQDPIADLDRVSVGFSGAPTSLLRRVFITIRHQAHARSPYVISLRGMLASALPPAADERVSQAAVLAAAMPARSEGWGLSALTAFASDLCIDGTEPSCREQFTPVNFSRAYTASYGWAKRPFIALSDVVTSVGVWVARPARRTPSVTRHVTAPSPQVVEAPRAQRVRIIRPSMSFERLRAVPAVLSMGALLVAATLPANAVRFARSMESSRVAVVSAGERAVDAAKGVAADVPLPDRVEALRRASTHFREADDALGTVHALAVGLASLVPETRATYRTARALAEIGAKSSDAGQLLATGFSAAFQGSDQAPLDRLRVMVAYTEGALPLLQDANDAFRQVDVSVLPAAQAAQVETLRSGIEDAQVSVREFIGLADFLGAAMGSGGPRRYLVLFQNPSELRPTGGFLGSFAEITVTRGDLTNLRVPGGGTYDVQGQLTARLIPPEPLQLIAERWEFQDANWSPDFATAAEAIRFFWSKSGGPTMDGIIAVNATVLEQLLVLTGPIDVPELGKTITAENFILETQKAVELEYDRTENQPKKIIGLLAPRVLERLKALPQERIIDLFRILSEALETKEVQIAMKEPSEQAFARRYGWTGELKPVTGDALAVIGANIAGQKTDLAMEEQVHHEAIVAEDGGIEDHVTVVRTHTATKGEIFYGVRNVSYLRFYVPRGSTLLSAEGFRPPDASLFDPLEEGLQLYPSEADRARTLSRHATGLDVWEEGDRTVFGGWSMVDPGKTETISIQYRLPFTAFDLRDRLSTGPSVEGSSEDIDTGSRRAAYTLLLTSQSGTLRRQIHSRLVVPESWEMAWGRAADGIEEAWDRDRVTAALFDVR
jgi:hypothetical protein